MNTNTTAGAKTTWPPDNTEMLELYQPIVEGMTKYSAALSDGYAAMGSEWFSFVNRRFHTDMSLAGRLAKCASSQDLMREWSAFVSMASEDYRNEFARLAEMSSATSQRAASAIHTNGQDKTGQGSGTWASRGV
jgi:Phasin protein